MNLLEFSVAGNPNVSSPPIGQLVKNGSSLEFTYSRPVAALADVSYRSKRAPRSPAS